MSADRSAADGRRPCVGEFCLRPASSADMPGIARVRFAVRENVLTPEQLAARGITNDSVAASLLADRRGWVAERAGEIVAFSMADRADPSIFALFVLPDCEGRGLGGRLLEEAMQWLWQQGAQRVWLTTGPDTRAHRFYVKRGWARVGDEPGGDVRLEYAGPQANLEPIA
jgi:GNAT superfamily N-acetyltransferase